MFKVRLAKLPIRNGEHILVDANCNHKKGSIMVGGQLILLICDQNSFTQQILFFNSHTLVTLY